MSWRTAAKRIGKRWFTAIHYLINLIFIYIFLNFVCYITNKFGFLFIGGVAMTTVFQRQCWLMTSCHFLLMFDSLYPRQPTWFWLSAKCRQSCLCYSVDCSTGLHKSLWLVSHLCWSLSVSIGLLLSSGFWTWVCRASWALIVSSVGPVFIRSINSARKLWPPPAVRHFFNS